MAYEEKNCQIRSFGTIISFEIWQGMMMMMMMMMMMIMIMIMMMMMMKMKMMMMN